ASDIVVLRTITSTGNPSYINIGPHGVYLQKSYGDYDSQKSNLLNLYCRDVYFSSEQLSLVTFYNTAKTWINKLISAINNHADVIVNGGGTIKSFGTTWD
ncbi:MAG: hypothetical protein IJU45_02300, partial [Clostridia bacterium]|nr:hypothetical protein [Clostridia bacterium]